jgi:two-component system chemotaxis response regulator CheY
MKSIKKTILVVDDFTSIRDFVCEILEQKGYITLKAKNGNEAFSILIEKSIKIDLVLSDYNMPECDGFELLTKIKTTSDISDIPVIFLTTESDPGRMNRAMNAGLAAWIKKPYQSDIFYTHIERALA